MNPETCLMMLTVLGLTECDLDCELSGAVVHIFACAMK